MIDVIKTGAIGYICYKSLCCFGKKDYADIIMLILILYIGTMVCLEMGSWYNSFMNSAFMQLMFKIFG